MTRPNVVFRFSTIDLAFEYANVDEPGLNKAYLDRHTGQSLFLSGFYDSDEVPDDIDDSTRYVELPDKRDLGLGSQLAQFFVADFAPSLLDEVCDGFRRRGGFRTFKDILIRNDLLDAWHQYEAEHERKAIVQWCVDNDVRFTMDDQAGG